MGRRFHFLKESTGEKLLLLYSAISNASRVLNKKYRKPKEPLKVSLKSRMHFFRKSMKTIQYMLHFRLSMIMFSIFSQLVSRSKRRRIESGACTASFRKINRAVPKFAKVLPLVPVLQQEDNGELIFVGSFDSIGLQRHTCTWN